MAESLTTLKARIASELHRDDLTDEIDDAINTAISYYRSHRFEFNEKQTAFNTVASQEAYTVATIPSDIGQLDTVRITVSGNRYLLEPTSLARLQELSVTTTTTGAPSRYAFYAQQLYLNPIPDAIYSVLVSYQQRKAAPSSDADTSTVWTNEAEALIRACAKKLLCRDVIYDNEGFQRNQVGEGEALAVLKNESIQLQDEGGIQPNW